MNENKKIAINSIIIFIRLVIVSLIGLLCSRLVLNALGASDYGLYNVVGGVVTILNVVNSSMISSSYRFIAFELGKGVNGNPNKVFNVSFVIHAGFSLLIVLLGLTVGEWYISNYLNVAAGKLNDAQFVFRISIATTAISTLLVPFQGLLVAFEKFSINAIIDIFSYLLRISLIFLCLRPSCSNLRTYSFIMMAFTLSSCLCYLLYCVIHYKNIIKIRVYTEKKKYVDMLSYAGWSLFGIGAYMLKSQGSNLVINFFFGTVVNAAYAVSSQVENFIMAFARSLNNAATPQITKNYSGGNQSRVYSLSCAISKYSFILMTLIAFPVILEMDFLLEIWLKNVPEGAALLCKIMVVGGLFECLGDGITPMFQASGNIKKYQVIIHTILVLGIPLSIIAFHMGANPYAITLIYTVISLFNGFLKLFLVKKILGYEISTLFRRSYFPVIVVSLTLSIFYFIYSSIELNSTIGHLLGILLAELYSVAMIFIFAVTKDEKCMFLNYIRSLMNRKFKKDTATV